MFPWIDIGPWEIGPFTIHAFGVLVGLAIITGVHMSQRDADKRGLNPVIMSEAQIWAIVVGFIMAHWVSVIFYFPERVRQDPLELLRIWKGISSFGGFIGGVTGLVVYLKLVKKVDPWPYIDSIGYGFAFAWILGRMGCTTAHDHPGRMTEFAFSVSYPYNLHGAPQFQDAAVNHALPWVQRYDLGLYELIFAVVLVTVLVITNRKAKRYAGYNVTVLALMYAPVRFFFDYLRIVDKTYDGLTPGQYLALGIFALGLWMAISRRKKWHEQQEAAAREEAEKTKKKGKGKKGGGNKDADKKSADKKDADKKDADKKDADKKSADKKSADKKSADKKSADKKSADKKDADEQDDGTDSTESEPEDNDEKPKNKSGKKKRKKR